MKKTMILVLVALCMLFGLAYAQEEMMLHAGEMTIGVMVPGIAFPVAEDGMLTVYPEPDTNPEFSIQVPSPVPDDAEIPDDLARVVMVTDANSYSYWVLLPEDMADRDMLDMAAVQFSMAEDAQANGMTVYTPATFEVIGEVANGYVSAMDDGSITLSVEGGSAAAVAAGTLTLSIGQDTRLVNDPAAGTTCEVLYDGDGYALKITRGNG